ncbi:winged helix-turn-helix domain-containing protein [Brevundimonas sp. VNH65]|uniref:winged helix-turn-helix domain-containing protein n=1 Tax=Brevundimonas sp. VNH65 TaxID=3400917 RepID=UPI003BFB97E5
MIRFAEFALNVEDRRLTRDGTPVAINARYLDALILLASEPGRLVAKDRFMTEVWKGVPVTDEALTQCIRTLRRILGDNAVRPTFIETAPRHGYRFIAEVRTDADSRPTAGPPSLDIPAADVRWGRFLGRAATTSVGGLIAGLIGGIGYGLVGLGAESGGVSTLAVLACLTGGVGLMGGAGVGLGLAAADFGTARLTSRAILGAGLGGLATGAAVRLIGMDAFTLLFGQAPARITGAFEGLLLGAAVGAAAWRAQDAGPLRASALGAVVTGAAALLIVLSGGRLMAGSLASLSERFPASRLHLDAVGALFGEAGLGPLTRTTTGLVEGALFGACVVAALAWRRQGRD